MVADQKIGLWTGQKKMEKDKRVALPVLWLAVRGKKGVIDLEKKLDELSCWCKKKKKKKKSPKEEKGKLL